jgi:DHA1 family tetracycline resistance protein-like MFS transporter
MHEGVRAMTTTSTPPTAASTNGRSALPIILLTVFITMIGFGIVIPVLPVYAKQEFQLTPSQMGWLVGIFSLMQLVASPIIGKISDRVGRKPVLILSIVGTAVGFFILGMAHTAWMLFLGRIIDGASGGNIATAQACIADVTTPEKRTKAMGLIGATFGLGFIMGPALGGILGAYSHQLPFYFAAWLSLLNLVLVIWVLPETLSQEQRLHPKEPAPMSEVFVGGRKPFITLLLGATLVSTIGFAFIHVLFALFCQDHFGWTVKETSYAFTYVGFLAVLVQGGLLRRLLARNIEKELALTGAVLLSLSLYLLPRSATIGGFLGVCALLALGNGLLVPTLTGMSSRHVHGRAQGRVLGLMAAAGSLGRFLGPAIAVLPLPAGFSAATRSGETLAALNRGYVTAFTWSAGLVLLAAVLLVFLRVPNDVPEEAVVVAPV